MNIRKWDAIALGASDLMFGGGSDKVSSGGSSEWTPAQKDEFDKLLGGAGSWLDSGGLSGTGNEFMGDMGAAVGDMGSFYRDVLGGGVDEGMLQSQLDAQSRAAQSGLDTQIAGISSQGQLAGSSGGSRQGIAEGVATGEANQNLIDAQSGLINDAYQQEADRKMQAASGMGNVAQGYAGMQDMFKSDAQQGLDSLLAFKELISGDMGGITEESGWQGSDSNKWQLSDDTTKKNVKDTGDTVKAPNGEDIDVKTFEYTDEAKKEHDAPEGRKTGVLASEAEEADKSLVKKGKKKKKRVNYGALGL